MQMKSFLDRQVRLAFGSAILILVLIGALSIRWMSLADRASLWARHTHDVLERIQDLNLAAESIQSVSRRFALTGKESDLEQYGPSVVRAKADEEAIRTLTVDNPDQQIYFPLIESLTDKSIRFADTIIDLRRARGMAAAAGAIENGGDQAINDEFQAITGKMQHEEDRLLVLRRAKTDLERKRTRLVLILGTLLGVLVALGAARSVLHEGAKRQASEDALRESEVRYRMLLDGVQDYAIFMLDTKGVVLNWSLNAERLKGYTAEEIVGQHFSRFFLTEDIKRGRPDEVLHIAAASGRHEEFGMRVRKDGSEFLASITFIAMRDEAGNLRGFSEICRDLSEHKESEARYRGLLEAAPDGMVVVNRKGEIVLLNAQAEKQFGYHRDELLGKNVKDIIPKGFAERLIADGTRTSSEALAQQMGTGIELSGRRKNGSEFPIEIMLSPLDSAEGILVTAAIRDISVRKDADRHLEQMEARYRGLLEAAPDGMVVVNSSGEIVLLNAQAEKQFGYHRNELLGQKVTNIIPTGFAERLIADGTRTAAEALAQQIGTGIELHGKRRDGNQFPIEIMLSPLKSEDGVLVTAAIRDISERKQLERQLQQSQKMEAVGQLTGGIAHDFNNLLTVIIGNLGLLDLLVSDNEAAVKRVQTALKAAARGADITRRLLVFSSNEELKPVFVPLQDSIDNVIEMASRGLGLDIRITTTIDASVPPVFVDPAGLESSLLNLVVNARDAMPTGGSIIISSLLRHLDDSHPAVKAGDLKPGCYVCVLVTDTGQGMSREILERACEPFFTTKSHDRGTGLGLAMVYGFVKQSGGVMRIYSELGHGTTVSFYLPVVADLSHQVAANVTNPLDTKLGSTVLVVDDEEDILEVAIAYLAKMNLTTFEAKDGDSALKLLAKHNEIDLMLTDVVMAGGMNGAELSRRARILRPGLKIIYSSGFPAEALTEKAISLVDGPLLRKPYQRAEFAAIISRAMESSNTVPNNLVATLPADAVQHELRSQEQEHGEAMVAQQRILVVDDDNDFGEFVSSTANAMGFQCTTTNDANRFLQVLAPDTTLVLLDLMMPGMDGVELLRLLGERKCKAGIVLVSAIGKRTLEAAEQLARVLGLSIVGHLQKPFTVGQLQQVLRRLPSPEALPIFHPAPPLAFLREELQHAIENNEFVVYYQPQIEIVGGRVTGVEALARWQHPGQGLIFPDRFIARMEEFGLIDELGWIVAARGMSEVGRFADDDGESIMLSLNASTDSLLDLNYPDVLISIAENHNVFPENLTIEITESGLIKELSRTLDILTRLRMKQVKLSIDDFGTGYAMMQQFKHIPATELKIDRCFVQEMTNNERDLIMIQKSIEMAHCLGIQVVAEGVETEEQLDLLKGIGCDMAQGYLFSRPLPANELVNWLKIYRSRLVPVA
jgi:PAS domain S-box-containing protein